MLDDLLGELFGRAAFGRLERSRRAQLIFRLLFGLAGAGLGILGVAYMLRNPGTTNPGLHASMVMLFASMACFFLFNVGWGRTWRWPAVWFVVSFVLLFVTRIVFGR